MLTSQSSETDQDTRNVLFDRADRYTEPGGNLTLRDLLKPEQDEYFPALLAHLAQRRHGSIDFDFGA
jgi:hypothetical protein